MRSLLPALSLRVPLASACSRANARSHPKHTFDRIFTSTPCLKLSPSLTTNRICTFLLILINVLILNLAQFLIKRLSFPFPLPPFPLPRPPTFPSSHSPPAPTQESERRPPRQARSGRLRKGPSLRGQGEAPGRNTSHLAAARERGWGGRAGDTSQDEDLARRDARGGGAGGGAGESPTPYPYTLHPTVNPHVFEPSPLPSPSPSSSTPSSPSPSSTPRR